MQTHVFLRINWQLILTLTHLSYSKCKDTLHILNVYKIHANEYDVVDRSAVDEILISEILFSTYLKYAPVILRNCKKLKRAKIFIFTICSF